MTPMGLHARKDWTRPHVALGAAVATLGLAIGILGFLDIYLSVTHLLHPIWGDWSWTVIVLGEGSFAGCYLGWLLLVLRDRLPAKVRVFLVAYLAVFASGSLVLMVDAGHKSVSDIASHVIVVLAFYGFLLFVKVLIHRLSADLTARAMEEELADVRRHAIDLVRDRCGMFWRFTAPRLLRRQITSGRFPHAVMAAVRDSLAEYGPSWEPAVGTWIADGLAVRVKAQTQAETVHEDITRRASEARSVTMQETPLVTVHEASGEPLQMPSGDEHETRSATPARERSRKPSKPRPRVMSDDELMPYIRDLLAEDPGASISRARKATGTGPERAKRLLERGQEEERQNRMALVR